MSEHERMTFDISDLIKGYRAGNERFIQTAETKKPGIFKSRVTGQTPHTAVVECADSWVALGLITKTPFGRIFTITKNAANIVDPRDKDTSANATYALNHLPSINLIVVNGHYDCGGVKGLDHLRSGKLENEVEAHLKRALPAVKFVDKLIRKKRLPKEYRHNAIVEANVLLGMENLHDIPAVQTAISRGIVKIEGSIYDPFSGKLHFGFPVLEKYELVGEAQQHFNELAMKKRTR